MSHKKIFTAILVSPTYFVILAFPSRIHQLCLFRLEIPYQPPGYAGYIHGNAPSTIRRRLDKRKLSYAKPQDMTFSGAASNGKQQWPFSTVQSS